MKLSLTEVSKKIFAVKEGGTVTLTPNEMVVLHAFMESFGVGAAPPPPYPFIVTAYGRIIEVIPELPLYRCHKEVHAAKIDSVECGRSDRNGPGCTLVTSSGSIPVSETFMYKHNPEPGGYFVVYEDGYQSYSPAKAFEEGYTRI